MKPKSILTALAAALLAPGALFAQTTATTTPVGYVTQTIAPNSFTYVGLTVHQPVISSGLLTSANSTSVTHSGVDFTALLTSGQRYVLELENGTIQEIQSWNSSGALDTPQNISAQVTPNVTRYNLRKVSTVSDIFGANNSAGLTSTDAEIDNADQVFIKTGSGTAIIYYFNDGSPDTGWYTSSGDPAGDFPIVYSDGFYIQRKPGSSINLVTSGQIKDKPTSGVLNTNWNLLSSVSPTGLTLSNSGLNAFISKSEDGDFTVVDNIYIPNGSSFDIVYYFDDGSPDTGWYTTGGDPAGNLKLEGAFYLLSKSASAKPYTLSVPSFYNP